MNHRPALCKGSAGSGPRPQASDPLGPGSAWLGFSWGFTESESGCQAHTHTQRALHVPRVTRHRRTLWYRLVTPLGSEELGQLGLSAGGSSHTQAGLQCGVWTGQSPEQPARAHTPSPALSRLEGRPRGGSSRASCPCSGPLVGCSLCLPWSLPLRQSPSTFGSLGW